MRGRIGESGKVPAIVPDIPVIHSPKGEIFASPTRGRGAWCLGDRDGGPGLSKSRKRQAGAAGDQRSDLRRQAVERASVLFGASREEAPEESIFLKRDAAPEGLRIVGEQSGTQEWFPQEGPQNNGWFWLGLRLQSGRADRKTSEPSGGAVR